MLADTVAPVAVLTAADVNASGASAYQFTVAYTDDVAVDTSTIDGSDIIVTGPGGPIPASFVSVDDPTSGTPRTATYEITPPGGTWDMADNGAYSVDMQATQVTDTSANPVAAGPLGTFNVGIVGVTVTARTANAAEAGADGTFRFRRSGSTAAALTVNFDAMTGTATQDADYALMVGNKRLVGNSITIPAGRAYADVRVAIINDLKVEGSTPETVIMNLAAGTGYEITTGTATVNIADNDPDVPYYNQDGSQWSWAASLSMVLKYYGIDARPWSIAASFRAGPRTASPARLSLMAYLQTKSANSFTSETFATTDTLVTRLQALLGQGKPVYVALGKDAVVVGAYDATHVYVNDPSGALRNSGTVSVPDVFTWNEFKTAVNNQGLLASGDRAYGIYASSTSTLAEVPTIGSVQLDSTMLTFQNNFGGTNRTLTFAWDGRARLGYTYLTTATDWYKAGTYGYSATQNDTLNVTVAHSNFAPVASSYLVRTTAEIRPAGGGAPVATASSASDAPVGWTEGATTMTQSLGGVLPGNYRLVLILEGSTDGGTTYTTLDQTSVNFSVTGGLQAIPNATANDIAAFGAGGGAKLLLACYNTSTKSLQYFERAGGGWSAGTTVDATQGAGQYVSIAADSTGAAGIAYYDAFNADLKYAHFNGATWDVSTVDMAGRVGLYPSLAFDAADQPVISYYNKTSGNLKLAAWNGIGWVYSTLDYRGDTGRYTSLAANPLTGRWAVSYESESDHTFRLAERTRTGWTITKFDTTKNGGGYTSLAFASTGQVGISYYDAYNADVKYATRSLAGVWALGIAASGGSVGMYSHLHFGTTDLPEIVYYNKSDNAVMLGTGTVLSGWTITQLVGGGGRELSTAYATDGTRTISWFDTATGGLLVQEL